MDNVTLVGTFVLVGVLGGAAIYFVFGRRVDHGNLPDGVKGRHE